MEAFAAMREIQARKSSIDSSCFPANCSSRDQAFNTASWLTSSASAAFLVSPRARRYSVGMYGETISPNASGFPFRARASKLERHCGPALKQRVTVAALISGVQVAVGAPGCLFRLCIRNHKTYVCSTEGEYAALPTGFGTPMPQNR